MLTMQAMPIRSSGTTEKTGTTETEKRNLEDYRPLVRQIAVQVANSVPRHVELDELVSSGMVGLIEAARRYDPDRGVKFEAFVSDRVRGAIIDFLRSLDWAPRSVRSAGKRIDEARAQLALELGHAPAAHEVAAALGMTADELRVAESSLAASVVLTLDRNVNEGADEDSDSIVATLADTDAPQPDDVLEHRELSGYLADAIDCLPEQARTVVALYYLEGMHMAEIGDILGVTQSRASQIHSAAIVLLRDALKAQLDSDDPNPPPPPRGRRAKRIARFHESVANASDWRERLDGGHRTIVLDFSDTVRTLEERHAVSTDTFDTARRAGHPAVVSGPDRRRWALIIDKTEEIRRRRSGAAGSTSAIA